MLSISFIKYRMNPIVVESLLDLLVGGGETGLKLRTIHVGRNIGMFIALLEVPLCSELCFNILFVPLLL